MVTISQKKIKKSLIFYWYYKKINSLNFPSPLIVIILKKKRKKFTDCINDRIIIKEGDNIIFGIYKSEYCILNILFQLYV